MNNLEQKIESILFFKGEPVKLKKLAEILKVEITEINQALINLKNNLENRGLVLMETQDEVVLAVSPTNSLLIENLQKEELNKDLSKASLETLSIIIYKNGATRSEIDFIRGVNSNFTLRVLSIRGLVEKVQAEEDSRRFVYKPTFDLLAFLGISKVEDMPGFMDLKNSLEKLEDNTEEVDKI